MTTLFSTPLEIEYLPLAKIGKGSEARPSRGLKTLFSRLASSCLGGVRNEIQQVEVQ